MYATQSTRNRSLVRRPRSLPIQTGGFLPSSDGVCAVGKNSGAPLWGLRLGGSNAVTGTSRERHVSPNSITLHNLLQLLVLSITTPTTPVASFSIHPTTRMRGAWFCGFGICIGPQIDLPRDVSIFSLRETGGLGYSWYHHSQRGQAHCMHTQ